MPATGGLIGTPASIRQRSSRTRWPSTRSRWTEDVRDEANRVGNFLAGDHRQQRALGQGPVADVAPHGPRTRRVSRR